MMSRELLRQLRKSVELFQGNIGPDALIYQGSATWEVWQNHIPQNVAKEWATLSEETRLVAFLMAQLIAHWTTHP